MIKKLLFVFLLAMFLFAGTGQAQVNDLPSPGMLPDSPFYFLKSWAEDIGTFFTFGDVAKAQRFLNLSEKRLAEANALVSKSKPEVAEEAIGRYQEQLDSALVKAEEAKTNGLDVDEVLAKVSEATLKHQAILADVYERVPEQAKSAIKQAMQAGVRGHEEALKAVSGQKREGVMQQLEQKKQEVEQKLERFREKGVPVPAIPGREEIEEGIPAQPGIYEDEVEAPGAKKPEIPEIPEIESEIPGDASEPETGKPETPGRP